MDNYLVSAWFSLAFDVHESRTLIQTQGPDRGQLVCRVLTGLVTQASRGRKTQDNVRILETGLILHICKVAEFGKRPYWVDRCRERFLVVWCIPHLMLVENLLKSWLLYALLTKPGNSVLDCPIGAIASNLIQS
jgi:hypothetical protein